MTAPGGAVLAVFVGARVEIAVSGTSGSYDLPRADASREGTIEVTVPAGVEAYSFTFG